MKIRLKKLDQSGFDHVSIITIFVVIFALIGAYFLYSSLAATTSVNLKLQLDTNLCMNNAGGSSVQGHSIIQYSCDGSTPNNWVLHSVSGGFQLQTTAYDGNTVCVNDTSGHIYGDACTSSSTETWHWSSVTGSPQELQNNASGGCINDPDASKASGTQLIVYSCALTKGNPTNDNARWNEVTVKPSTSDSGGGATTTTGSGVGAEFIARAKQWQNLGYANTGGYGGDGGLMHADGYASFIKSCEYENEGGKNVYGVSDGTPVITDGADSTCATDCSGFVSLVVDDILHTNYVWIAGDRVLTGSAQVTGKRLVRAQIRRLQNQAILWSVMDTPSSSTLDRGQILQALASTPPVKW